MITTRSTGTPTTSAAAHLAAAAGRARKATARVRWRTVAVAAALFLAFATFLGAVQSAAPGLVGNDGYYHIKLAYLMRTEGLRLTFPWLPLTILNADSYVDHHFLYHILLLPFTFGDLRIGAKAASVLFASTAFVSIWWLLRGQRVPFAALWSLGLLAVSEAFLYRMSMTRTQSLSLAVLVLATHTLLKRRHAYLAPLAFLYVWLYNAFPLIVVVAGIYTAAVWLTERRLEWRALIYVGGGLVLGLIAHPYFPDNLLFSIQHILPKITAATATPVGSEWYPYDTGQLLANSGGALLVLAAGVVGLGLQGRRMSVGTAMSLFMALFTGYLLLQSRRFVEYFPAFALIFAAVSLGPVLEGWIGQEGPWRLPPGNASRVRGLAAGWGRRLPRPALLASALVFILVPASVINFAAARESVGNSQPYGAYAAASAWLTAHTPPGARVFQTDWDDFPKLFYFNHHNTYTLGLDPTYMQYYDQELYEVWVDVTQGRAGDLSGVIIERFGAEYAFTDLHHRGFLERAAEDPRMIPVYRDSQAAIFRIVQLPPADRP